MRSCEVCIPSKALYFLVLSVFATQNAVALAQQTFDPSKGPPPFGGPDSGGGMGPPPPFPSYFDKVRVAHAVLASAAWLIFFPMGSILIRTLETKRVVQVHYIVQTAGLVIFVAAAGMGIWMAKVINMLHHYHPIIGLVLLGGLALQPLTELSNHFLYRRFPKIIYLAHFHIWFGRLLITVGIIQGGLGFVFAGSFSMSPDRAPRIAYGVVAIVVWILYVSLAIVWPDMKHESRWWQKRHGNRAEEGEALRNRSLAEAEAPSAIDRPTGARK